MYQFTSKCKYWLLTEYKSQTLSKGNFTGRVFQLDKETFGTV